MSGAPPLPAARPWGGRPSPVARLSRALVVLAWRPSTGPTACALARRRCALWGWREGVPGGGASHCFEGRLRLGPCPLPGCSSLRREAGVRCPGAVGAGVRVRGPGTVPVACVPCGGLHSAGFAGGRPLIAVRGVWCQALSLSRPPILGKGGQPLLPVFSELWVVWVLGPSTSPIVAGRPCALWGWREGVSGGGWLALY